ncbi:hypothetical protein JIN84_04380 [Luteolibacter yonseiensis]|uniref:Uncharacterized protein n=1 Tax=Luteolibacter yonseiensis TaxID=1144680 RepID=A0A934V972_9BACT|nr:hypothetical protein [Luteolibacter yonseiensis]MBK1814838.1 hypothetical protein [Luteolibacter yonseiensis]
MKSHFLKPLLASGLFLVPAISLQAGVETTLKLDLRCYYQKRISTSNSHVTGDVEAVRLDSKQLLKLLAKQTGLKYSGGSQLRVATSGKVIVTDSKGNAIADVSRYFTATLAQDDSIFDGKYKRDTLEQKTTNYFPISFTINLPALKGTVSGIATEKLDISKPDKFDIQRSESKSSANVNGQGQLSGNVAYFDGKLSLSGKDAAILKD